MCVIHMLFIILCYSQLILLSSLNIFLVIMLGWHSSCAKSFRSIKDRWNQYVILLLVFFCFVCHLIILYCFVIIPILILFCLSVLIFYVILVLKPVELVDPIFLFVTSFCYRITGCLLFVLVRKLIHLAVCSHSYVLSRAFFLVRCLLIFFSCCSSFFRRFSFSVVHIIFYCFCYPHQSFLAPSIAMCYLLYYENRLTPPNGKHLNAI